MKRLFGPVASLVVLLSSSAQAQQPTAPAAPAAEPTTGAAPAPTPVAPTQPGQPIPSDSTTASPPQPGQPPPGGAPAPVAAPVPYAPQPGYAPAPTPYAPPQPSYAPAPAPAPYAPPGYRAVPFLHEPPPPVSSWPEPEVPDFDRFRLAAISESAFSADEGPFYNHLLGGRFDYRLTFHSSLGLYLAYANMKGTQSRVHSLLGLLQYEYRFFFGETQRFAVPVRLGIGHLVHNGTPIRFSAGFFYSISDSVDIGADLIAPMFWPASGDTVISMNLSGEVSSSF